MVYMSNVAYKPVSAVLSGGMEPNFNILLLLVERYLHFFREFVQCI